MPQAATVPKTRGLNCPGCGAALETRGFAHTLSIVCPQCLATLDAQDPNLQVLQAYQGQQRHEPLIPLGSRGKLDGFVYETIGFQVRAIEVECAYYSWREYLLFNPYKGFRYLTEYNGHWNLIRTLRALPEPARAKGRVAMRHGGDTYAHFQHAEARTEYVMGEFPWRVQVGETVQVDDYIAPPRVLSSETTGGEVVWSLGEYLKGDQVWQAFQLPDKPPARSGVYANQPSPFRTRLAKHWLAFLVLEALLLLLFVLMAGRAQNKTVFSHEGYRFPPRDGSGPAFVTDEFELGGRTSNVEVEIRTDLDNSWAAFNLALINVDDGQTYDFGVEVSYYRDSDGSEGSRSESVTLPSIPSGRYYLRVEPEMAEPEQSPVSGLRTTPPKMMTYGLEVKRDVTSGVIYVLAAIALVIPPILASVRRARFEKSRWAESDYGG